MRYVKMNGAGNDFVIFDARKGPRFQLTADQVRAIADRKHGVGCDQLIVLEPSSRADAFMRVWNADGGAAELSGNGARCVAWLLVEDLHKDATTIEIVSGLLTGRRAGDRRIAMEIGPPRLDWREIPVARQTDTVRMDFSVRGPDGTLFSGPGGVSMGNPHAVFFVPDAEAAPAAVVGPMVETDPFFPERVNVGFAQVIDRTHMRLRVWERGAGLTQACGTGACAAVVAAHRAGLTGRCVEVRVDGGLLDVEWRVSGQVVLTGPVEVEGTGDYPLGGRRATEERILEIGITSEGLLFLRPERTAFPAIYRTASGVRWSDEARILFNHAPGDLSYAEWFNEIVSAAEDEYGVRLHLFDQTIWTNVPDHVRAQLQSSA